MAGKTQKTKKSDKLPDKDTPVLDRAAKLSAAPKKKKKAPAATPRKAAASARTQAAVPLRADMPKKVGAVSGPRKSAKPSRRADYQPKTELPPLHTSPLASVKPAPTPLAIAKPWMTLGLQMFLTGLTMQARMARALMSMSPAGTAMRQGTSAANAWAAFIGGKRPASGPDKS